MPVSQNSETDEIVDMNNTSSEVASSGKVNSFLSCNSDNTLQTSSGITRNLRRSNHESIKKNVW